MKQISLKRWFEHILRFMKRNRLYLKIMASYLAIFLTILIIESISIVTISEISKENSINSILLNMEKSIRLFESRLNEIQSISLDLSSDDLIVNYRIPNNGDIPFNYSELMSISDRLKNCMLANDRLANILVCYKNSSLVVSPSSATFRIREFEDYFQIKGFTRADLLNLLLVDKHNDFYLPLSEATIGGTKKNVVIYISSFPRSSITSMRGNLALFIDEKKINEYFTIFTDMSGWFLVSDRNQAIYAQAGISTDELPTVMAMLNDKMSITGFSDRIQYEYIGNSSVIFSYLSPTNGWFYTIGLPLSAITKQYSAIRQLYKTTNVITLIVGTLIIMIIIWRNALPVNKILKLLSRTSNESSIELTDFKTLEAYIKNLLNRKDRLEEKLKKQVSLANSLCVDRLLRGTLEDINEIDQIKELFRYDQQCHCILVSILKERSTDEIRQVEIPDSAHGHLLMIKQVLNKMLPPNAYIHVMGKDRIVIVWIAQANDNLQSTVTTIDDDIAQALKALYAIDSYFLNGGIYNSITGAAMSYHDALVVELHSNLDDANHVIWYSGKSDYPSQYKYNYSIEFENRLINLVKIGVTADVKMMLDILLDEMGENQLHQENLISGLKNTTLRLLSDKRFSSGCDLADVVELFHTIDSQDTFKTSSEILAKVLLMLSDISQDVTSQKGKLLNDIRTYINNNFADANLSLTQISDHFGLNESYFSSYFKELSSQNFSTYVENYRLNEAIALMKNTDLTINEIALKCGYTNKITFYRAFKRNYFQSPSEYRSSLNG